MEGLALGVESQYGLNSNIDTSKTVLFKHNLTHAFSVLPRIHWWFGEQHLLASWIDLEFFIESIVPQVTHIFPVADDTVFHGLGDLEEGPVGGSLVADHYVFDEAMGRGGDAFFSTEDGSSNNGGEY